MVSSTLTEISCNLASRDSAVTKTLSTNSSSAQVDGYIGGSGFKYYKYDISSLGSKNYQGLKDAVDSSSGSISLI